MKILKQIREWLSKLGKPKAPYYGIAFPYSPDNLIKRQQLWSNLQKGLLFEDKRVLIPWLMPFDELDYISEKRHDSGDRTMWYLGERTILDGYQGHFEVMKWLYLPWSNPITEISEPIGHDFDGMKKFHYLNDYLTNLLGEPTKKELEKFGSFDLGVIQWHHGLVKLTLVGIEHFNCRYSFSIGLVRDRNEEYLNKSIEEMKTNGLTEEELGK